MDSYHNLFKYVKDIQMCYDRILMTFQEIEMMLSPSLTWHNDV